MIQYKRGIGVKESMGIGIKPEWVEGVIIDGEVQVIKDGEVLSTKEVVRNISPEYASSIFEKLSEGKDLEESAKFYLCSEYKRENEVYFGEELRIRNWDIFISTKDTPFIDWRCTSERAFSINGKVFYIPKKEEKS